MLASKISLLERQTRTCSYIDCFIPHIIQLTPERNGAGAEAPSASGQKTNCVFLLFRWIADVDHSERISSFIVVFACACKVRPKYERILVLLVVLVISSDTRVNNISVDISKQRIASVIVVFACACKVHPRNERVLLFLLHILVVTTNNYYY